MSWVKTNVEGTGTTLDTAGLVFNCRQLFGGEGPQKGGPPCTVLVTGQNLSNHPVGNASGVYSAASELALAWHF